MAALGPVSRDMVIPVLACAIQPRRVCPVRCSAELASVLVGKRTLVLGTVRLWKSTLVNPPGTPGPGPDQRDLHGAHLASTPLPPPRWYFWLDSTRTSAIIDSPGFQEFAAPTSTLRAIGPADARSESSRRLPFLQLQPLREPGAVRAVQPDIYEEAGR